MGTRPLGLRGIAFCYFAEHRTDGTRAWSWMRFVLYGLAPIGTGVLFAFRLGEPTGSTLALVVAVLSVLAGVLVGLLPLVHSVVGQSLTDRRYAAGERALAQQELDRIQTLQDLHAAISWAVVLLVGALVSCAVLSMIAPSPRSDSTAPPSRWLVVPLLIVLYAVMASTALTFFDVARGVFEGMESHSQAIKTIIRRNTAGEVTDEKEI